VAMLELEGGEICKSLQSALLFKLRRCLPCSLSSHRPSPFFPSERTTSTSCVKRYNWNPAQTSTSLPDGVWTMLLRHERPSANTGAQGADAGEEDGERCRMDDTADALTKFEGMDYASDDGKELPRISRA